MKYFFVLQTYVFFLLSKLPHAPDFCYSYNTRYAWAGGTFFPVVLLCQFSVLAGKRFWFYILFMYLEYHTVVALC
jgi:hypothetical protein